LTIQPVIADNIGADGEPGIRFNARFNPLIEKSGEKTKNVLKPCQVFF